MARLLGHNEKYLILCKYNANISGVFYPKQGQFGLKRGGIGCFIPIIRQFFDIRGRMRGGVPYWNFATKLLRILLKDSISSVERSALTSSFTRWIKVSVLFTSLVPWSVLGTPMKL